MKFTILILSVALFSVCIHVTAMPLIDVTATSSKVEFNMDGTIADDVELSISAKNLIKKDILSKSDPMCVTFVRPFASQKWVEYHRTEVVSNNHNPVFVEKPIVKYKFEQTQYLRFELYDVDSSSKKLKKHDFLGYVECHLGEIMNSKIKDFNLKRKNAQGEDQEIKSKIFITVEKLLHGNAEVVMQLSGIKLDKDFIWSDPFIKIYKVTETDEFVPVYKTDFRRFTLNPKWEKIHISIQKLCNGDYNRTIKFMCYDHNNNGEHNFIGEFQTSLKVLSQNIGAKFPLIHSDKQKKNENYKNSGEIRVDDIRIVPLKNNEFIEYIMGGLQIHCIVAIDFTESNGKSSLRSSLHNTSRNAMNQYEMAISSVVAIIEDYDSDKRFPVLGFGAKVPSNNHVSHKFFVNLTNNPFCVGVQGVLDAYRKCIRQVTLFGPTYFSPVIEHVIGQAHPLADGNNYFILLILTDGTIHDMIETKRSILKAAKLPISLIIVGVGNADFSKMDELDGDRVRLTVDNVYAEFMDSITGAF